MVRHGQLWFPVYHSLISSKGLRWEDTCLVPFTIYFDDSGTASNQKVANATGLIIPGRRILQMEQEWQTLKQKEGFADFHTSEFVAKNPHSEFANWDDTKHKRVFRRVRQITRKYGAQIFSFSVKKDDYEQCIPPELRKYAGRHHYSWAIRHVSMFAQKWRYIKGVKEPYEWRFDWIEKHEPLRKEIEEIFDQMEYLNHRQRGIKYEYTGLDFRPRASLAGLQCVDLVAWTNYNIALQQWHLLNRPLHPFAEKAFTYFASVVPTCCPGIHDNMDWNHSVVMLRKHLRDWAAKEIADGRYLALFKEWEAHKKRSSPSRPPKRRGV